MAAQKDFPSIHITALFPSQLESFLKFLDSCYESFQNLPDYVKSKNKSKCIRQYCDNKVKPRSGASKVSPAQALFPQLYDWKPYFCSLYCHMSSLKGSRDRENYMQCLFPGCTKERYREYTGRLFDYCGKRHAKSFDDIMKMIWEVDQQPTHHYSTRSNSGSGGNTSAGKKGGSSAQSRPARQILFYNKDEPFYEFTNFASYPVIIDEVEYPTTEHYFQSQKFIGSPYHDYIATLPYPRQAFEFPRQPGVRDWVRRDWEKVKEDVMYRGLYHKFTQHHYLLMLLLSTGEAELIEDSPYDSYWGCGPDHQGKNRLGVLLMRLREVLKCQISQQSSQYLRRVGSTTGERNIQRRDEGLKEGEEELGKDGVGRREVEGRREREGERGEEGGRGGGGEGGRGGGGGEGEGGRGEGGRGEGEGQQEENEHRNITEGGNEGGRRDNECCVPTDANHPVTTNLPKNDTIDPKDTDKDGQPSSVNAKLLLTNITPEWESLGIAGDKLNDLNNEGEGENNNNNGEEDMECLSTQLEVHITNASNNTSPNNVTLPPESGVYNTSLQQGTPLSHPPGLPLPHSQETPRLPHPQGTTELIQNNIASSFTSQQLSPAFSNRSSSIEPEDANMDTS